MDEKFLYLLLIAVLLIPATAIHYYGKIWNALITNGLESEVPHSVRKYYPLIRFLSLVLISLIFFVIPFLVFDYESSYRIYGKSYSVSEISDMEPIARLVPPILFQFLWGISLFSCWSLIAIQFFAFRSFKERVTLFANNLYESNEEAEEFISSMIDDDGPKDGIDDA